MEGLLRLARQKWWIGIAVIFTLALGVRPANQVQAARHSMHGDMLPAASSLQIQHSLALQELEQVVTSGPLAASRPWTKQEMLAARPAPRPEEMDLPPLELPELPLAEPTGPEVIAPSRLPADSTQASTADEYTTLGHLISPEGYDLLGYSYPAPFTRLEVFTSYTTYPYRTIGKLFFRQNDGYCNQGCVCSASVVNGRGVITAGHCIYDPGNEVWSYGLTFVPAYKDGNAPYGQWTPFRIATLKGWTWGSISYDIGMLAIRDRGGRRIGDRVGWLGFWVNTSRNRHWNAFGYPSEGSDFNGQRLIVCQASYAYQDTPKVNPNPTGIGCDMTGGSSGGPWLLNFSGHAGPYNYVNGVNSYGRNSKPKEMFSPYFGQGARNLYDWAKSLS